MQIKITKKLLNKYRKYKQEIPLLKEELEEMQTTDAGLGNYRRASCQLHLSYK